MLADDSRATMLLAMLDGRAWTASELARCAGVARSTASEHLDRLHAAGLITQVRQGRHRYLRIEDPRVAEAIESLAALSDRVHPRRRSLRAVRADEALREARTCYRHLAGRLGVELCAGLLGSGVVSPDWQLTERGRAWFDDLGVEPSGRRDRPAVRPCLDWTERREHLAGTAADALLATLLQKGWLVPGPVPRSLRLTHDGRNELGSRLPIVPAAG